VKILRHANDLFDQIVEDCAPRPTASRQVTVTVAVDPVWHGHDLTDTDAQHLVHSAINARPGLEVVGEVAA
jgi:hypothetical protein